jgi:hypothetical protein
MTIFQLIYLYIKTIHEKIIYRAHTNWFQKDLNNNSNIDCYQNNLKC